MRSCDPGALVGGRGNGVVARLLRVAAAAPTRRAVVKGCEGTDPVGATVGWVWVDGPRESVRRVVGATGAPGGGSSGRSLAPAEVLGAEWADLGLACRTRADPATLGAGVRVERRADPPGGGVGPLRWIVLDGGTPCQEEYAFLKHTFTHPCKRIDSRLTLN